MSNARLLVCTHSGNTHHQHTDQQTGAAALCVSKVAEQQCARRARDVPNEEDAPEAEGLHSKRHNYVMSAWGPFVMSIRDSLYACQHNSMRRQAVTQGSGGTVGFQACFGSRRTESTESHDEKRRHTRSCGVTDNKSKIVLCTTSNPNKPNLEYPVP
jgi:hypothetical protein